MRGPHGVCDCDILRRANVKADLYLLRGGFVRTLRTPPGYGHECRDSGHLGGYEEDSWSYQRIVCCINYIQSNR